MKRRTLLKSASVGLPGIATVKKVSANTGGNEIGVETRSFGNPIDSEDLASLRKELLTEPSNNANLEGIIGTPSLSGGEQIVSWVGTIGNGGALKESIKIASKPADVPKAISETQETVTRLQESGRISSLEADTSSVSSSDSSWTTIRDSELKNYDYPYGDVVSYFEWQQSDDNIDVHQYNERFAQFPGSQEYGSNWENDRGYFGAKWGDDSQVTCDLLDWEPFDGTDGSVSKTVTLSYNTFSKSYSYTTSETEVKDRSSDRDSKAEFAVYYNGSSKTSTSGYNPGTMGQIVSGDPRSSPILFYESTGTLYNFWDLSPYHNTRLSESFYWGGF